MAERLAQCGCGQLKARCATEPLRVSLCHCLDCQKRTGSLFGVAGRWRREDVRIEGASTEFRRGSDDGFWVAFHFCPVCGSTVFWESERDAETIAVAVGAFADPDFLKPMRIVYSERRHRWLQLPDDIPNT